MKIKISEEQLKRLTEKVDSIYIDKIKKTAILNKSTVGQRLAVSKRKQLVSKKKQDAGILGYEIRRDYLDLAKQYKDVMNKDIKK